MCEQVLTDTLEGKIQTSTLFKWLLNEFPEQDCLDGLRDRKCSQSDFILYFINFIHDTQAFCNKSAEILHKTSTSTPKQKEDSKEARDEDSSETFTIRRRSTTNIPKTQTEVENFVCSTPKTAKIVNNTNPNYASPLSPLYNRQELCVTPNNNNKYIGSHSSKTTPGLCLADFISSLPSTPTSSKKKWHRSTNENSIASNGDSYSTTPKTRRIKPTDLAQRKYSGANFSKSDNSFSFRDCSNEIIDHSNGERSFLVEERMKIISRKSSSNSSSSTSSLLKPPLINKKKEIVPLLKLVSFKQQLDALVLIYNFMLDHNFILNLSSELYFLILLLFDRTCEDCENDLNFNSFFKNDRDFKYEPVLLGTVHNRVYFASKALEKHVSTLTILDRSIISLLVEDKHLQHFVTLEFYSALSQLHDFKSDAKKSPYLLEEAQSNVCFISDNDSRDNFPDEVSFHSFRKQRDLFYEIIRIWETNHLQNEWTFAMALGGKIRALLNMHLDVMNLVHFARLFKAQLLKSTCGKAEDCENGINENQLSFLMASLPNVDTEKLLRLKRRIVNKQNGNSINALPTFNGYQEFYRDFILVASNHVFIRHLIDTLISEIIDLNNTRFSCADFNDKDDGVDLSTQHAYAVCVKSLRILAKFLGFVESLPYKNGNENLSQSVMNWQIRIRDQIQPGLNIKTIITNALANKCLILTIPWLTKYLSMLDYNTLRLSYFKDVIDQLFEIYYKTPLNSKNNNNRPEKNVLLIKLCLGWLFDLPHFPEDTYYKFLSLKLSPIRKDPLLPNGMLDVFLDELDLVNDEVLEICCPYLKDMKKLLSDSISSLNNSNVTVKHITPLTAVESSVDVSNKRIQLQLEEAFFNGQPVSIRKTVEFVSERVASACVKQICNEIVPNYKTRVVLDLRDLFASLNINEISDDDIEKGLKIKAILTPETHAFANLNLKNLKVHIDEEVNGFSSDRIASAIDSLLATDVLKQTKEVCVCITKRMCLERVRQWIDSHVNLAIFAKDFDAEIKQFVSGFYAKESKQKPNFALPVCGKNIKHNPDALNGFDLIDKIREYCCLLLDKPNDITIDTIRELLRLVLQTKNERCDVNEFVLVLINKMLLDLLILLVVKRPDLFTNSDIISEFCSTWKQNSCHTTEDLFQAVVCYRNAYLISTSSNVCESWKVFGTLLTVLLEEGLVGSRSLETQLDGIDKKKLSEVTAKYLIESVKTALGSKTV